MVNTFLSQFDNPAPWTVPELISSLAHHVAWPHAVEATFPRLYVVNEI